VADSLGDYILQRLREWGVEQVFGYLPDVSYADFARGLGLKAITVRSPDEVGPAWDRVRAADRPAVLDVHCDPEVPPIPPHATFDQAKAAARAVLKGDPEAGHLLAQGIKTKLQEALPHRTD
jgi:pyruvate dehydrogenase (quinone)